MTGRHNLTAYICIVVGIVTVALLAISIVTGVPLIV